MSPYRGKEEKVILSLNMQIPFSIQSCGHQAKKVSAGLGDRFKGIKHRIRWMPCLPKPSAQGDQMAILFFTLWPFTSLNICPLA